MSAGNIKAMRTLAVTALVLALGSPLAVAQSDRIDDFIKREIQRQRIPSVSVVVTKNGQIVKAAAYGVADMQKEMPATVDTVYRIGSISKQFIAAGITLLVQDGRLRLEDRLRRHLIDAPAIWDGITIQHLLTHTSGLVNEAPAYDRVKIQSDAEVIRSAHSVPLRFAPGDRWAYSNLGYMVLGEVIRVVTGGPWSDYIDDKLLKPAGMSATYVLTTPQRITNRAVGYTDNDRLQPVQDGVALHPAGGYLSTALDLAKWDAVLDSGTLFSEATRRLMWTPVRLNDGTSYPYGFGWELGKFRGLSHVHHGGETRGFRGEFSRFPEERLTVIVLMNLDDADIDSLVAGVANAYLSKGR